MLNPGPNQIRRRMFWKQTVYHVHKQNNLKIIIIKRSHVLPSGHRKGDAITSQQEIYFVWRIHFFAASFWIFFTSCLMILFLCRQTDTHTHNISHYHLSTVAVFPTHNCTSMLRMSFCLSIFCIKCM